VTSYVVLKAVPKTETAAPASGKHYERVGKIEAHGALAALRKAGEQWGAGTYVAIPGSRWSEETVGVETVTRVTVGAAASEPQS
jgi:hypothetical protein